MKIEFTQNSEMVIIPETSIEAMALRYWEEEFEEHGPKILKVSTQVPPENHDK